MSEREEEMRSGSENESSPWVRTASLTDWGVAVTSDMA